MRRSLTGVLVVSLALAGSALAASRPLLTTSASQTLTSAHTISIEATCPVRCRVVVDYTATHHHKQVIKSLPARNSAVSIPLPLDQSTLSATAKARKKHVAGPLASIDATAKDRNGKTAHLATTIRIK